MNSGFGSLADLAEELLDASARGGFLGAAGALAALAAGADPNHPGALDRACQRRDSAGVLRALLEAGADPNATLRSDGSGPLEVAASNLNPEAVGILLGAGAAPSERVLEALRLVETACANRGADTPEARDCRALLEEARIRMDCAPSCGIPGRGAL